MRYSCSKAQTQYMRLPRHFMPRNDNPFLVFARSVTKCSDVAIYFNMGGLRDCHSASVSRNDEGEAGLQ